MSREDKRRQPHPVPPMIGAEYCPAANLFRRSKPDSFHHHMLLQRQSRRSTEASRGRSASCERQRGECIDAHADRCERHRWERASGGGKATRLLTDARQSLAKAAFPAAGRQDDNSGKAQRTLQPIHSGAKYEDHNTRRSAHRSSFPAANRMLAEDRVSVRSFDFAPYYEGRTAIIGAFGPG